MAVLASALLCLSQTISAVPAKPGKITLTQPDGSQITVILHGDEWFHYVTDESGAILEEDSTGKLVKSPNATIESLEAKIAMSQAWKSRVLEQREEAILKAPSGSPKIPVILVEFKDKGFSISDPKTAFNNLLNQKGYSDNGATGSVIDYYTDQSRGAYQPQFVVMDVVTLSNNMSTYGSTDGYAAKALYEACQKLDSSVDFSQFDNDKDGKIDMALMYYAGYNEAEGGPTATIWPHQSYVSNVVSNAQAFDGVKLSRYFCTSELKGSSGTKMCGIGTTCHEFAHSLGLPDFYDTNYNNYGDGEAGATYTYDVMCSGSYNNDGCTPPWMNAEELMMLGWMDSITELTSSGMVYLPSIGADSPVAYKSSTSEAGEYFLYESRPGTGWDAPLNGGLLVYHVDKSKSHRITWKTSSGSNTQPAYNLWAYWDSYNAINCNGSHPCFYIIPAGSQNSLNYSGSNFTFPGRSGINTFTPIDWSGAETGFSLTQIAFNSSLGDVTFRFANTNECSISGFVMDSEGIPVKDATVTLSPSTEASNAIRKTGTKKDLLNSRGSMLRVGGNALQTVTTDGNGSYSFILDEGGTYVVSVSKDGYVSKYATVEASRAVTQNFYLLREGEEAPSDLYTYPDNADWRDYGNSNVSSWDNMCSNLYPASLLGAYEGKQIKSVSFQIAGDDTTTGKVYALIDFGTERQLFLEVQNPVPNDMITVDISEQEIFIPADKDVYVGYAIKGWTESYPFTATDPKDNTLTGYMADFDQKSSDWEAWNYVFKIRMSIGDYIPAGNAYNYIEDPNDGVYPIGASFALNLLEAVNELRPNAAGINWYYDDEPVSGESVKLNSAGQHTVKAEFVNENGNRMVVELDIEVN